jgi:hypothetical protein
MKVLSRGFSPAGILRKPADCSNPFPFDFPQSLARLESPVFISMPDDGFGHPLVDARNVLQQGWRGGVEIHPHMVDRRLDHGVQSLAQLLLIHVVLVEAHADGARLDLDQLGQGVLQAAGDGDRAAHGDVHVG